MRDSDPLLELTRGIPAGPARGVRRARPSQRKSSPHWAPPPPPPPVGAVSAGAGVRLAELVRRYPEPRIIHASGNKPRAKFESISDFEDTLVRASQPAPAIAVLPAVTLPTIVPAERTARSRPAARPNGARTWELLLVALASMLLTLAVERALDVHRVSVQAEAQHAALPAATASVNTTPASPGKELTIPIVSLTDLPLQAQASAQLATNAPSGASAASATSAAKSSRASAAPAPAVARSSASSPDRATLAAALARAARSARSCGEGPEMARVVVSYAPSGVPKSVRFGSVAPSRSLRGCVLGAMARAVIPPFNGDPVTVEKTISW